MAHSRFDDGLENSRRLKAKFPCDIVKREGESLWNERDNPDLKQEKDPGEYGLDL
jgi:hypothetical protein